MAWRPVRPPEPVTTNTAVASPTAGRDINTVLRVEEAEATLVDHETRLDAAEAELVALDARLDTAEADITALEAADVALDGRLDTLEAVNRRVIEVNDTVAGLRITQNGTGNALLVEDSTNPDTTPFVVDQFGQLGMGTTAPISTIDVSRDGVFQFTAGRHSNDGNPARYAARKSQGTRAAPTIVSTFSLLYEYSFAGYDGADYRNAALLQAAVEGTPAAGSMPGQLRFSTTPSGSTTPVENFRITAVGLSAFSYKFGYGLGAGSGGSVTQLTSKATAVTVNACTGQIVLNNSLLAAGARTSFIVNCNRCEAADTIIVHRKTGGTAMAYNVWCDEVAAGQFRVGIENYSGGGLSEAFTIQFTIIRGATA